MVPSISQYKRHAPSIFAGRPDRELQTIIARILDGAQDVRKTILETNPDTPQAILLRKQGFAFDIMYDKATEKCCLIELNSFGTRSGCGSCLFQWLKDENVLYGRGNGDGSRNLNGESEAEVEFRLSL
jgi:hypothetical protein